MEAIEKGSEVRGTWNPSQGGFRAAMFIFLMSGLENIGFIANVSSLVLYYMGVMHFDLSESANTQTNFLGAAFLLTLLGGFISDTYMTRLNTVLMFGLLEILGYVLMTLQAHYKNLHPDAECSQCKLEGSNNKLFYLSLSLMALGYGGIRGALPSLGADQFDRNNLKERKQLASFFNWFLFSITVGATFGVTIIVWISTRGATWAVGFFVSMCAALVGFAAIAVGKLFYRVRVSADSPLIRILQVIVVAIKNRNLSLPDGTEDLYEINGKAALGEEKIPHSGQFRFLDRAAVLPDGFRPRRWKVCSVTQVEEVKILIRMLPVFGSTILMNTCLAQLQTFSVQQGSIMDLRLGSFTVPPASIPVIPLLFMSLLVPVYEFAFVPAARRVTGLPSGITHLQRVGVGLVLSVLSMAVAAVIEVKRRNAFDLRGERVTVFWLSFQYGIFGVADLFTFVGLTEFFYTEAPIGMRSLSTSLSFLSLSFGFFLSSVFVRVVDAATARPGRDGRGGWLYGVDLNENRLDLFYWFLAAMSCVNLAAYVLCSKWYKYRRDGAIAGSAEVGIEAVVDEKGKKKMEEDGVISAKSRPSEDIEIEVSTDRLLTQK